MMGMNEALARLLERAAVKGTVLRDEPMARHTSFRVGGPADVLVLPGSAEELAAALRICREEGAPARVIGAGTNLIVADAGVRGAVIALGEGFSAVTRDGLSIEAEAGAKLARVSQEALAAGLTGLEFAAGIPGTVGGGAVMNAGAYGGEIAGCLEWADILGRDGSVARLSNAEMGFGYRTSLPLREGGVVLRARFTLRPGDVEEIGAAMREFNRRRRVKQPLEYPSAGSTFKRPEGHFAGALIEQAGCKGLAVGGAQVSEKHAGFIVNTGGATAADILALIGEVRRRVFEQSGVRLEREVRLLGAEEDA